MARYVVRGNVSRTGSIKVDVLHFTISSNASPSPKTARVGRPEDVRAGLDELRYNQQRSVYLPETPVSDAVVAVFGSGHVTFGRIPRPKNHLPRNADSFFLDEIVVSVSVAGQTEPIVFTASYEGRFDFRLRP